MSLCAILAALAGAVFYVGLGPLDVAPSARDLDDAAAAYRKAGMPWEAKDLEPNPPLKPSEDATPLLRSAMEVFDSKRYEHDYRNLLNLAQDRKFVDLDKQLRAYKHALEVAQSATAKERVDFHRDWDLGPQLLFPEYAKLKGIGRLFCLRSRIKASEGDFRASTRDLCSAWKVSSFAGQDPTLMGTLVEISMRATILRTATYCAAEPAANATSLSMLSAFLQQTGPEPDLRYALRFQAYGNLATFRNLDQYGGLVGFTRTLRDSESEFTPLDPSRLKRTGLPAGLMERAMLDRALRYWGRFAEFGLRESDPEVLGKKMNEIHEEVTSKPSASGYLDAILMPEFSQAGSTVKKLKANILVTRALIAALECRALYGKLPQTIDHIPGGWLDPFDGKPLRVIGDGKTIRIYSLGPDRKDDGGGDQYEHRSAGAGYDVAQAYPPILMR